MTSISNAGFQLCSTISKANGEDPIGSASDVNTWLLIEVPPPWPRDAMQAKGIPPALRQALEQVQATEDRFKALAIEPDRDYSQAGYTRIMCYRRQAEWFSQYYKLEYVVPDRLAPDLVLALFAGPTALSPFAPYRRETEHIRDMLVCTHGSRDACCGKFGYPVYDILRKMKPKKAKMPIRAWRASHIGGHKFAATLLDLPFGHVWGHLEIPVLPTLIEMCGSVEALQPYYRGWTGFSNNFLQIAEREIWLQEGWRWLDYDKRGELLKADDHQQWAEVRVDFRSPDGLRAGYYTARVAVKGQVQTLGKSGHGDLQTVNQYQVTHLQRVDQVAQPSDSQEQSSFYVEGQ